MLATSWLLATGQYCITFANSSHWPRKANGSMSQWVSFEYHTLPLNRSDLSAIEGMIFALVEPHVAWWVGIHPQSHTDQSIGCTTVDRLRRIKMSNFQEATSDGWPEEPGTYHGLWSSTLLVSPSDFFRRFQSNKQSIFPQSKPKISPRAAKPTPIPPKWHWIVSCSHRQRGNDGSSNAIAELLPPSAWKRRHSSRECVQSERSEYFANDPTNLRGIEVRDDMSFWATFNGRGRKISGLPCQSPIHYCASCKIDWTMCWMQHQARQHKPHRRD